MLIFELLRQPSFFLRMPKINSVQGITNIKSVADSRLSWIIPKTIIKLYLFCIIKLINYDLIFTCHSHVFSIKPLFMLTNNVHIYSREKLYCLNQIGLLIHFHFGHLSVQQYIFMLIRNISYEFI